MKKLLSIVLSFSLIFGLVPVTALATSLDSPDDVKQQISDVYGIPISVLDTLDQDTFDGLSNNLSEAISVSSEDTYIKITSTESGENLITESTYQEYLFSSISPYASDTRENSWMRIHTTILDKGSYAQVSAAYTWLTDNVFATHDVIGLSIVQGTFMSRTASGFRSYNNLGTIRTIYFTENDFVEQGHGITCTFPLEAITKNNFLFMQADIHKEAHSEGLNGSYGHQRISISFAPDFSIDRSGNLSCAGFSIGMAYDQYSGYVDIAW